MSSAVSYVDHILYAFEQIIVANGQRQFWVSIIDLLFKVDAALSLTEERHDASVDLNSIYIHGDRLERMELWCEGSIVDFQKE